MKFTAGFVAVSALTSGAFAWTSDSTWSTSTSTSSTSTSTSSSSSSSDSTWTDWTTSTSTSTSTSSSSTSTTDSTWSDWTTSASATPVSYTTSVVSAVTTYCPEATVITHGGKTWSVSSATTLTITDCPCTLTYPVYQSTSCSSTSVSAGWASYTTTAAPVATYTGAASAQKVGGALAGVVGVAAMLL